MKLSVPKQRVPRIELIPLIDVLFFLLVFFIYTMMSMAVHRGMPVALPKSATAEVDKRPQMAVSISQEGSIYLDKQPIDLPDLSAILHNKTMAEKEKGVQVFADREVEYQRLFMVLDSIKKAGISQISLQAERDGGS